VASSPGNLVNMPVVLGLIAKSPLNAVIFLKSVISHLNTKTTKEYCVDFGSSVSFWVSVILFKILK
jgi:hypothetical protein